MNRLGIANRLSLVASFGLGLAVMGGCDKKTDQPAVSKPAGPAASAPSDHGHEHGDGGVHVGTRHDLGKKELAGFTVAVTQVGEPKAGSEVPLEIVVTGAGKPDAVRAWYGSESGDGSTKKKAEPQPAFYDADVEVPSPIPAGAKVWLEVEAGGKKAAAAFEAK